MFSQATAIGHYEEEKVSGVSRVAAKKARDQAYAKVSFSGYMFYQMRQHKFALSLALNIIFIIWVFMPFLPGLLVDMLKHVM